MSKHTPGEWSHDDGTVRAADGEVICYTYQMQGEPVSVMLANACLMASAPELLGHLEIIAGHLRRGDLAGSIADEALEKIEAAIAKATGGAQ